MATLFVRINNKQTKQTVLVFFKRFLFFSLKNCRNILFFFYKVNLDYLLSKAQLIGFHKWKVAMNYYSFSRRMRIIFAKFQRWFSLLTSVIVTFYIYIPLTRILNPIVLFSSLVKILRCPPFYQIPHLKKDLRLNLVSHSLTSFDLYSRLNSYKNGLPFVGLTVFPPPSPFKSSLFCHLRGETERDSLSG